MAAYSDDSESLQTFRHIYSCDLDTNFKIKIGTLEGTREKPSHQALLNDPLLRHSSLYDENRSDLVVSCQVFSGGKPLALPVQTSYKPFTTRWNWNEWLKLPLKFSDLPRNAVLALTVWDVYGPRKSIPVGGTTVTIFGKYGAMRQGIHDLRLWLGFEADGSSKTQTPGKAFGSKEQMTRLVKLSKKHRNGRLLKVDWLDRLTFREIEVVNSKEKSSSNQMFLMIEFPRVVFRDQEYTVIYFEKDGDDPCQASLPAEIVTVPDPDVSLENLVESKHHKLSRSLRSGLTDKDLKPNAATRDQLNVIVNYPSTKTLTSEEQDLVWKFRFYLQSQKKALAKFVKCVNWQSGPEARQAVELMRTWQPMDVDDALELLGPQFVHPAVRRYAVARLRQAHSDDLLLYLLQLVQALKYERTTNSDSHHLMRASAAGTSALSTVIEPEPGSVPGERGDRGSFTAPSELGASHLDSFSDSLRNPMSSSVAGADDAFQQEPFQLSSESDCDLATFLINKACTSDALANYFYWYLYVETDDQDSVVKDSKVKEMYTNVMKRFMHRLQKGNWDYRQRRSMLEKQQVFVNHLVNIMKIVARENGNRQKKMEKLHALLLEQESQQLIRFPEPMPLPLDPSVRVRGLVPSKAALFKSALMPCRLSFLTDDVEGGEYVAIFKHGDDLRQDQLILQTITLMDKLLRKENLDLKLTPYCVLASSTKHGFVQYIESTSVADVLRTEDTIQKFFRKHAPSETGPYGISPEVMDTYVKSCAGYCVITYLLSVGDRHLDNLLLTKTGKLFHIDFGYILGRDPKPLPPPMKLSKEMVEAMGGINSEHYQEFRKQCYTAFLHLRRHANLILNLFSLMVDASVPDIALEPDKTVKKVQDKFRLDLTDEEAVHYMQNLIDVSVTAVMPALVEQIHKIAQYWRR
uniref:Phosphatidylinositol 3-kinase catalytic subunit type 3 n=1 Tax=Rhipicephalus zambeziensis TaxID=60191 RepID=A0A224Z169_9ACAR